MVIGDAKQPGDSFRERLRSRNPKVQRLVEYAEAVAATPYAVLLEGETGTGKEVFARGIHEASKQTGPFVPINCGAVPESMFEAELFGARRGAYTGLNDDRPGLFKVADRGTLFLDEIGDLPASMQSKLLRVLEDGEIRPLGAATTVRVHVRIIAATHKYLKPLVDASQFRRDLYFRLSAACIRIPPVRERPEDIAPLVEAAVENACRLQDLPKCRVSSGAMTLLREYPWPGNIREINNVIAGAVLSAQGDTIRSTHVSASLSDIHSPSGTYRANTADQPFFDALQDFESRYIRDLLRLADGNLSEASRISGLSRSAVRSKARAYGLIGDPEDTQPVTRSRVRKPTRP